MIGEEEEMIQGAEEMRGGAEEIIFKGPFFTL